MHRAIKQSAVDGKCPSGTIAARFRAEPDGTIRMLLWGESRLTDAEAKGVVDKFTESTMGRKWQFPQSPGPSLIEAEFAVGE